MTKTTETSSVLWHSGMVAIHHLPWWSWPLLLLLLIAKSMPRRSRR